MRIGQRPASPVAFNARTTPEVEGEIHRVSPDLSTDPRTGLSFYTVRIALSRTALGALRDLRLLPGMPVEAFIETPSRTFLSYLTDPLVDQVQRAFREK